MWKDDDVWETGGTEAPTDPGLCISSHPETNRPGGNDHCFVKTASANCLVKCRGVT